MRRNMLSDINILNEKLSRARVDLTYGSGLNPNGLRLAISKLSEVADRETVFNVSKRCLTAMDSVILNVLKNGYYHAKLSGDFRNARICRDKLLEYSRQNSSRISKGDRDFIESLAPKRLSYVEGLLNCEKNVNSLNENPDESNPSTSTAQHRDPICYRTSKTVNPSYSSNSGVTHNENIHETNKPRNCKTNSKPLQDEEQSTNKNYGDLKLIRKNVILNQKNRQYDFAKPNQIRETDSNNINVDATVQPVKKISSMSNPSRPCALFEPIAVEQNKYNSKYKPEHSRNSDVKLIERRSQRTPKLMKNVSCTKQIDKREASNSKESSMPVKRSASLKNAVKSTPRRKKRKRTNASMCLSDINDSVRPRAKRAKKFSSTPLVKNKDPKSRALKNRTTDSTNINTDTSEYFDTPKSTYSNRRGKYQILYKRRLFSSPRNSLDIYSNRARRKIN